MANFEYTKVDLKWLETFLSKYEAHFSNFKTTPEQFATEVFTKLKELNLQIGNINLDLWITKCMIVNCSDKYHDLFKHSEHAHLRELIAKHSDKYHDFFKNDSYWAIVAHIAKRSDKYHHLFKDHKMDNIRYIVAKFSDKYDNQFKNDSYWRIRKLVENREFENGKSINSNINITKDGIINIKQLCVDILKVSEKGINLPILDEKCLEFFFDRDTFKNYNIDKINSVQFIYYEQNNWNPLPVSYYKIKYTSNFNKNTKFLVYTEFKIQKDLDIFNKKIKDYCEYLNNWLELEHRKAGENLKISQMITFIEKINTLDKYLVPKDNLLVYLDEKYSIV